MSTQQNHAGIPANVVLLFHFLICKMAGKVEEVQVAGMAKAKVVRARMVAVQVGKGLGPGERGIKGRIMLGLKLWKIQLKNLQSL